MASDSRAPCARSGAGWPHWRVRDRPPRPRDPGRPAAHGPSCDGRSRGRPSPPPRIPVESVSMVKPGVNQVARMPRLAESRGCARRPRAELAARQRRRRGHAARDEARHGIEIEGEADDMTRHDVIPELTGCADIALPAYHGAGLRSVSQSARNLTCQRVPSASSFNGRPAASARPSICATRSCRSARRADLSSVADRVDAARAAGRARCRTPRSAGAEHGGSSSRPISTRRWLIPPIEVLFDAAATHQRRATLARASPPASTSIRKSRSRRPWPRGALCWRRSRRAGSSMARSRTSNTCRACASLRRWRRTGFFGRITGFKLEFGWWVFDGFERTLSAPELELQQGGRRRAHARYVSAFPLSDRRHAGADPPRRRAAADDRARAGRRGRRALRGRRRGPRDDARRARVGRDRRDRGSWATRVRRDDLLTFQIDGSTGSAVAGCTAATRRRSPIRRRSPRSIRSPISASTIEPLAGGAERPGPYPNPYRVGWEDFLRHLVADAPLRVRFRCGHPRPRVCRSLLRERARRRMGRASTTRWERP